MTSFAGSTLMINTNKINQVLEELDDYLTSVNRVLEHRLDNTVFYSPFSVNGREWTRALYKPRVNIVLKKIEPYDTELCFIIIITLGECQTNKPYIFHIKFSLPIEDEPKEILNNLKINFRLNFGVSTYSSFTKAYIQHVLEVISSFTDSANDVYPNNIIVCVRSLGSTVGQYYQRYGYANQAIRLIPLSSLTYGVLINSMIQIDIFKPYYNVTTGGEPLFLTSSSTKFKHLYTYSNIYNAYTLGYNSLLTNV